MIVMTWVPGAHLPSAEAYQFSLSFICIKQPLEIMFVVVADDTRPSHQHETPRNGRAEVTCAPTCFLRELLGVATGARVVCLEGSFWTC